MKVKRNSQSGVSRGSGRIWHLDTARMEIGSRHCALIAMDQSSRRILSHTVKKAFDSLDVVNVLNQLSRTYGNPETLVMDRGEVFADQAVARWAESRAASIIHPSIGRSSCQGAIERYLRSTKVALPVQEPDWRSRRSNYHPE